jgi:hypothetical protein
MRSGDATGLQSVEFARRCPGSLAAETAPSHPDRVLDSAVTARTEAIMLRLGTAA